MLSIQGIKNGYPIRHIPQNGNIFREKRTFS